MRIDRLSLTDFTVFAQAELEFSPGLNVLIGANGTGKSHVLKVLYSLLKATSSVRPDGDDTSRYRAQLGHAILMKLSGTFRPDSERGVHGSLIRRGAIGSEIQIKSEFGTMAVQLKEEAAVTNIPRRTPPAMGPVVFIPTNEVLSIYDGFIAAYDRRELSFDETYYDLCVALSGKPLKAITTPGF